MGSDTASTSGTREYMVKTGKLKLKNWCPTKGGRCYSIMPPDYEEEYSPIEQVLHFSIFFFLPETKNLVN